MLARELAVLAVATEERGRQARRPFLAIRALSALAISLVLLGLWYLARHIHARWEFGTINNLFDALNTGFNLLVLLAGALWFCVTLEARIKRKEALAFIEELREFAHVIDVTQLYYTPDLYRSHHGARPSNPAIDETYLLHCTQMLGVISNLAPLYTRGATGDSILRGLGGPDARDGHHHEATGQGRGRAQDESRNAHERARSRADEVSRRPGVQPLSILGQDAISVGAGQDSLDSLVLADRHVHFLAGLGDFLAQALVLAFELARVHPQHFAKEGAMASVGLALELLERFLDLIGQVEQELRLSLDVGQRSLELDRGCAAISACQPVGRFGDGGWIVVVVRARWH